MNGHHRLAAGIVAVATILITSGCGASVDNLFGENPYNHTDEEIAAGVERLKSWPSLEATEAALTRALDDITDAAARISPELRWEQRRERSQGGCSGEYGDIGGLSVHTPNWVSPTPISDEAWTATLQSAREIAATIGLTQITIFHDKPGNHDLALHGDNDTEIRFGTQVAAIIRGTTGCRLPEARRGQ